MQSDHRRSQSRTYFPSNGHKNSSIYSVVELLVHFESFRNIDLYHQGIYFLRCCLYYQKGDKLYYAQPYSIFSQKLPIIGSVNSQSNQSLPPNEGSGMQAK